MALTWTGANGTDLGTAANWNPQAVPSQDQSLIFDLNGGGVLTGQPPDGLDAYFSGANPWVLQGALRLHGNASVAPNDQSIGSLTIESNGTVTNNGTFTFVGGPAGSNGTMSVTGTGALLNGSAAVVVGNFGTGVATVGGGGVIAGSKVNIGGFDQSNGSVIIQSGGTVNSQSTTLGGGAGGHGTIVATGAGALLNAGTNFSIGLSGTGVATVGHGGVANAGSIGVGNGSGSSGQLKILNNGTVDLTGPARIGISGAGTAALAAQGVVSVEGAGALLNAGTNAMYLGGSTGGNGSLTVARRGSVIVGSVDSSLTASLSLAFFTGDNANVTVTDPGSVLTANGYLMDGRGGTASLLIEHSGAVIVNDALANGGGIGIGAGAKAGPASPANVGGSGSATVTTGGTLILNSTTSVITVGGNGVDGVLNVDSGGAVLAGPGMTVGTATYLNGTIYGGTGTLNIGAGGSVKVTAASPATSYAFVVGDANSSVGGPTDTASGMVTVTGLGALLSSNANGLAIGLSSNGSMTVSQGATVVAGSQNDTLLAAVSIGKLGDGSLTLTGAGTQFTANGGVYVGRSGTGTLTVENSATASVLLDGKGDSYLDIGRADLTNGNTLETGGSGLALVTTGGRLFTKGRITVGQPGGSGVLTVTNGGTVETTKDLVIGNTTTVPADGSEIAPDGTNSVKTATAFSGVGSVVVGAGGYLQSDGAGIAGSTDITVGAGAGSAGTLSVGGTDAQVNSNSGNIAIGGAGRGTLNMTTGAVIDAGTGQIDISNQGTIVGAGLIEGDVINSGGISSTGGTLEITGSLGARETSRWQPEAHSISMAPSPADSL